MADAGVKVLLCGAIAPESAESLRALGIEVVMGLSGPVATVVAAYVCGALDRPEFTLPGFERTVEK
jgi:predicted Fe-Mo cluster-binding NifX family protein